jgi:hypothetical protein
MVLPDGSTVPVDVRIVETPQLVLRFKRHPELFIPRSIKMWYKDYIDRKVNKGDYAPFNRHDMHACYMECKNIYTYYLGVLKGGTANS